MENICISKGICKQLIGIFVRITSLTDEIVVATKQDDQVLVDEYTDMRMQELEQAQRLTLALTELIVGDVPGEESNVDEAENSNAFAEGELIYNLGDKTEGRGEDGQE